MTDKNIRKICMKIEVKLAYERFKSYYKKIPKGIEEIYTELLLSNDFKEIERLYSKFFRYIKTSKHYKDKWKEE